VGLIFVKNARYYMNISPLCAHKISYFPFMMTPPYCLAGFFAYFSSERPNIMQQSIHDLLELEK
jgi:hypothetical protein